MQGSQGLQVLLYLHLFPLLLTSPLVPLESRLLCCSQGPALGSSLLLDSSFPSFPSDPDLQCLLLISGLAQTSLREAFLSTPTTSVLPVLPMNSEGRDRDFCLILSLCLTPGTKYTLNICSTSGNSNCQPTSHSYR